MNLVDKKLQSYKQDRSASFPVHRLPTETLCQILRFDVDTTWDDELVTAVEIFIDRVMLLRLVCFQWKSTIDSAQTFWNRIPVNAYYTRPKQVEFLLKKSQTSFLDVWITGLADITPKSELCMQKIVDQASRWRSCHALFPSDDIVQQISNHQLPNLKSFTLDLRGLPNTAPSTWTITAPKMESLTLRGAPLQGDGKFSMLRHAETLGRGYIGSE